MSNISEILQYYKVKRLFDDPEKRQVLEFSLHRALSFLLYYGENPKVNLQPLSIPYYLETDLFDLKGSASENRLRVGIADTKFREDGVIMNVNLTTPRNTSRLIFTYGSNEFMAIHYYPDYKNYPHLYLISAPGDVLELKGMRQPDKPKVIVESGGLVYTYRRFGTEESLTIKYENIEAVMSHLTPFLREDGVAVDVWGTFIGTDRPQV